MNIEKARARMEAYFAKTSSAQIVKNLKALGCQFEPLEIEDTFSMSAKIIKFSEQETQTLQCEEAATNGFNLFVAQSLSFISAA